MKLKSVLESFPRDKTYLIEILLKYQKTKPTQHLTEDELKDIAEYLTLPESHIFSVVAFYSFFSMEPRGKFIIQYCRDVPCHVNGAMNVKKDLETLLAVQTGETTKDGIFTLEYTSCLGSCDGSPAVRVNDKIYTKLTSNKIKAILAECRSELDA